MITARGQNSANARSRRRLANLSRFLTSVSVVALLAVGPQVVGARAPYTTLTRWAVDGPEQGIAIFGQRSAFASGEVARWWAVGRATWSDTVAVVFTGDPFAQDAYVTYRRRTFLPEGPAPLGSPLNALLFVRDHSPGSRNVIDLTAPGLFAHVYHGAEPTVRGDFRAHLYAGPAGPTVFYRPGFALNWFTNVPGTDVPAFAFNSWPQALAAELRVWQRRLNEDFASLLKEAVRQPRVLDEIQQNQMKFFDSAYRSPISMGTYIAQWPGDAAQQRIALPGIFTRVIEYGAPYWFAKNDLRPYPAYMVPLSGGGYSLGRGGHLLEMNLRHAKLHAHVYQSVIPIPGQSRARR